PMPPLATRRTTTHQHNTAPSRERVETSAEPLQPAFIGDGQGKTEQTPARTGAHRGEVGKIDGQAAPADIKRGNVFRKMAAGNQGVQRHYQLLARCRHQYRRIITRTDEHTRTLAALAEKLLDQLEFVHGDTRCRVAVTRHASISVAPAPVYGICAPVCRARR